VFSVITTLRQALELGVRHFWLLLALSALAAVPSEAIGLIVGGTNGGPSFADAVIGFVGVVLAVATDAIKTAAILGVLKTSPSRADLVPVIRTSIRTYTWTLIRLSILLMLITFVVTIPFSLAAVALISMHVHVFVVQILLVMIAILYLVFIKYALANPLIVVEDMRARQALVKSWEMTKGRFWYVLGCYVLLGTAEYSISSVFTHFVPETPKLFEIPLDTLNDFCESVWVLVAWRMYLQIREADGITLPPTADPPPESPSVSQGT
jgi:hypothetical protein